MGLQGKKEGWQGAKKKQNKHKHNIMDAVDNARGAEKNTDEESFGLACLNNGKLFEEHFCQWFVLDLSHPGSRMEVPRPT